MIFIIHACLRHEQIPKNICHVYLPIFVFVGPLFLRRSPPLTFFPLRMDLIFSPFLSLAIQIAN